MLELIRNSFALLPTSFRMRVYLFQLFILLVAALEMIGVAAVGPFIGLALSDQDIHSYRFIGDFYSWLGEPSKTTFVILLGVTFCVVVFASNLLALYSRVLSVRLTSRLTKSLSVSLFEKYLRFRYWDEVDGGAAKSATKINNDVAKVCNKVIFGLLQVNAALISVAILLLLILIVNPLASVVILVVFGLAYSIVYSMVNGRLKTNGWEITALNRDKSRVVIEALNARDLVRNYSLFSFFTGRLSSIYHNDEAAKTKERLYQDLPYYLIDTVTLFSIVLVVVIVLSVQDGGGNVLSSVGVIGLAGYRTVPKLQIVYRSLIAAKGSQRLLAELVSDFSGAETGQNDIEIQVERSSGGQAILTLDNIDYGYNRTDKVLRNIKLRVAAGDFILLTGSSGAGKSTITKILLGEIQPESGSVKLACGERKENVSRPLLAKISADMHIFTATALENISLWKDVDKERLRKAVSVSGFDSVMAELQITPDEMLGEAGRKLSSGQSQKLAFARALYHQPKFLILDEATNALDGASQEHIFREIRSEYPQMGVLIVSHRPDVVQFADKHYQLEAGTLIDKHSN